MFHVKILSFFVTYFLSSKTGPITISKRLASLFNVILKNFIGLVGLFWGVLFFVFLFNFFSCFVANGEKGSSLILYKLILATY